MRKFPVIFVLCLALAACSGTKEQLGLTKSSPDEFAVVKRAPLSLPPDYNLRPPTPGAARPQEQAPAEQARQTVFGRASEESVQTSVDDADELFLMQAGAHNKLPGIRQLVDQESTRYDGKDKPVAEKLLGITGLGDNPPPASVVNAPKEAERIRENIETGKPITAGETPAVER